MAHASRHHVARALIGLCLAAPGVNLLAASPAAADPVDKAEAKVHTIDKDRKQAVKKTKKIRKTLVEAQRDLALTRVETRAYRTALAEVQQRLAELESQEGSSIGRVLSAAAEVTTAPDPAEALDRAQAELDDDMTAPADADALEESLEDLRAKEVRQSDKVRELTVRHKKSDRRLKGMSASLERAYAALQDARAEARAEAEAEAAAAPSEPAAAPAASGGAAAAVAYAMGQVGDAYVYGAMGPDAFDCSGLTMAAWAQGGVSLPHSSGAQMGSGTPVSIGALQPGDLVFYYSPVSHVGIYVGNGQIVHAANPSTGVAMAPVGSMPISGAVRPG